MLSKFLKHAGLCDTLIPVGQYGFHLNPAGETYDDATAVYAWNDNRVVDTGLSHILANGLTAAPLYIAPFSINITPGASLTAATVASTLGEVTAYSEATRVLWAFDAVGTNNYIENTTTPALFTLNGASTIWGFFLVSVSGKSSTSGTLVSAMKLPASKPGSAADELRVKFRITLTPAA